MMPDFAVCIVLPAYNEQHTVAHVIDQINSTLGPIYEQRYSVVVVDDGSTDDTAREASAAGAYVLSLRKHEGLAAAFRAGVSHAMLVGADVIVNVDSDGQHPVGDLPRLIGQIVLGYDLAIGSRFIHDSPGWKPWIQTFQSKSFSRLFGYASGVQIRDVHSGFRAFNAGLAERVMITSSHSYTREQFYRASQQGARIIEIPVRYTARTMGRSRLIPHRHLTMLGITRDLVKWEMEYRKPRRTIAISIMWGLGTVVCSLSMSAIIYLKERTALYLAEIGAGSAWTFVGVNDVEDRKGS